MALESIGDAPLKEPIAVFSPETARRLKLDAKTDGIINYRWYDWLWQKVLAKLNSAPQQIGTVVSFRGLSTTQSNQPIILPTLIGGRYRVSIFQKIRQAAGTNSNLQTLITFTNNSIPCTLTLPDMTGNTTATCDSRVVEIVVDPSSPITWSATRTSVGAPGMTYDIDIVVEALP